MALGATIFKAEVQIADMDRGYYHDHALVIARHPSETDERMMVRLLAFVLNASDALAFGRGLSSEDEADLCRADLTGRIELWIDVGLPTEKAIRKASGRAQRVCVYAYGGRNVNVWWQQVRDRVERCRNLAVYEIPQAATQALATMARRTMKLQCSIQDGRVWLVHGEAVVEITPAVLLGTA